MPLRVKIKKILQRFLPASFFGVISQAWRKFIAPLLPNHKESLQKYTDDYLDSHELVVASGPFAGLKYVSESAGSTYLLKLLGCYEEVLHPVINTIKANRYTTIIDIGCAEGYYLVGLGQHFVGSRLIGYDIDEKALSLTKDLAKTNGLQNQLILKNDCTASTLQADITENTLLICDAEGFEEEILNPQNTPALATVKNLLIETHEAIVPTVVDTLRKRFADTHTITEIKFTNAEPDNYEFLMSIPNKNHVYELLRERGEQDQRWLFLTKK